MWMNVQGARPIEGLRQKYLEAGGGQAGIEAIRKEFAKFGKSIDQGQIEESVATSLGTVTSKATSFQERLDALNERMLARTIPAMERLEEPAIKIADAFAKTVTWAAENPLKAISVAMFMGIVRAAAESSARLALERALTGRAIGAGGAAPGAIIATGGGPRAGGGFFGPNGAASSAMMVGGGIIGGLSGLSTAQAFGADNKSWGGFLAQLGASGVGGLLMGGPLGALVGATVGAGASIHENVTGTMGGYGAAGEGVKSFVSGDGFFAGMDRELNRQAYDAANQRAAQPQGGPLQVKAEVDQTPTVQAVNSLGTKTLNVHVTNMPAPGDASSPPRVSDAGRQAAL
jgi:hypothetical protein